MLCQKCGHFEATVHTAETVYRQKIEQHLCALCAGTGGWLPPTEVESEITVMSHTSTVKRSGRVPPPLDYTPDGLLAIAGHVTRLYGGEAPFNSLVVYLTTGPVMLVARFSGPVPVLIPWMTAESSVENAVRDFLKRHNVFPLEIAKQMPWAACYQLPALADDATRLLIGLLATCFDVRDHDPLGFQLIPNPIRRGEKN